MRPTRFPPAKLSPAAILLFKAWGCIRTFGMVETVRRTVRESRRSVRPRDPARLDVSVVAADLVVGAAPRSAAAVRRLTETGVTDVIDLRAERPASDCLLAADGIQVHWVPTYDDWRPKPAEFFEAVVSLARRVAGAPNSRLLVCCKAGEHRAPLGGATVLADRIGDLAQAFALIRAARPVAEFLPVYTESLRVYFTGRDRR